MFSAIDKKLQRGLPKPLYRVIRILFAGAKHAVTPFLIVSRQIRLIPVQARHRKARAIVRRKEKIKALFLLTTRTTWKYDSLYRLMEEDERFEPVIVICPYVIYGEKVMREGLEAEYQYFSEKGYRVVNAHRGGDNWLDVKRELHPDLLFFSSPYPHTRPEYCITNFRDTLTFYVPYAFMITNRPTLRYRQDLHFLVYRIFQESQYQQRMAVKHSLNRGSNSVVTGYPGIDFAFNGYGRSVLKDFVRGGDNDPWKETGQPLKRIIWAPHHSVERARDPYNYSNFLEYADFFLELAHRYEGQIQFSFKPHPLLKPKLMQLPEWGEERTRRYYGEWERRPNCQLNDGTYFDLFLTSDAMIHDSISFLVEYLSTGKPSLYMVRDELILTGYSALGREIIDVHYQSRSREEVISFIEKVVARGDDPMRPEREKLIKRTLQPPNGLSAGENMMNEIRRIVER